MYSSYIPYVEDKQDLTVCGRSIKLNASQDWADKKVVLFAVPGGSRVADTPASIPH